MGSRQALFPTRSGHPETIFMPCSFAPNGTGAPASADFEGPINSVSRTGVGVFEVTFKDTWPDLLSCVPGVQLDALADTDVQIGSFTPSTRKLIVRVKTAGVAADIAANANNRINLLCVFRNTTHQVKS